MSMKSKRLLVLLLLFIIGLLVHYPSFNLSLYGDDWLAIYNCFEPYYTNQVVPAYTGPLPGILAYLTPYGPSNCLTGLLYLFFGTHYQWYYLVSLFLKIFAAFSLFLLLESILKSRKILALLSSVLFLAGYTGIQNTDWAAYMIVYFSAALFILALFFRNKFLVSKENKYLVFSSFLASASLVSSPVRLFPIIFVIPMIDLIIILSKVYKFKYLALVLADCIFILSIYLFWAIGLFGTPGKIYSYGGWSVGAFINFVSGYPIQAVKSFLYWISVVIVPDKWFYLNNWYILLGAFIVYLLFGSALELKRSRSVNALWLLISLMIFFVFLLSMWYFSPSRLIDSADRYLLLIFVSVCFFIPMLLGQAFFSSSFMKRISLVLFLILIIAHWSAISEKYNFLLSHGRNSEFVNKFDGLVLSDLQLPVTDKKFIYLDVDDTSTQQALLFGLGVKILVLSKNWDMKNWPDTFDEKSKLFEKVKKESLYSNSTGDIIKHVFAYRLKGQALTSAAVSIRQELLDYLKGH